MSTLHPTEPWRDDLSEMYADEIKAGYTPAQAVGRCFEAFRGGDRNERNVLGAILALLALHDPPSLSRFRKEVDSYLTLPVPEHPIGENKADTCALLAALGHPDYPPRNLNASPAN